MLQLFLLILPVIIEAASSVAQPPVYLQLTEEAYIECDEQAIELVEELAQYHCRDVLDNDSSATKYNTEGAMQKLLYLGKYAYRDYNFLDDDTLAKPALLQPKEALLMMRACLLQSAAAKFLNSKVDSKGIVNSNDCVEEVMQQEFDDPLDEAEKVFRTMDKNTMLSLPDKREHCMDQVLSSFAREWVMATAIKKTPDSGIGPIEWLKGTRHYYTMVNMSESEKGVEWPTLWIKLKTWKEGVIKGWLVWPSYDSPMPFVEIHYVE